jgi:putative tryptophan/tyrosine transport system substrate-binding protein
MQFDQLKRREFMTMLAGAVVTPLPVTAQEPKRLPLIALVLVAAAPAEIAGPDPTFAPARAFVHELRDLGWIDGRTAGVEVRSLLQGDPQTRGRHVCWAARARRRRDCSRRSAMAARCRA